MKRLLLIAFHFPPFKGSSGIQRTLSYCRYLPAHGWDVTVLTAHPRAYPAIDEDQLHDIPESTRVVRCFALDSARHLSIRGRYLRSMALPDQWISWLPAAIITGKQIADRESCDAIMSTYPIATAHMIAHGIQKRAKIPWIADFRDSMVDPDFPEEPAQRRSFTKVEANVMRSANRAVFAAPGSCAMYADRYPQAAERLAVIENGYEEAAFDAIDHGREKDEPTGPVTILHSGLIYPSERDPTALFDAIAKLKSSGQIDSDRLRIVLRASGSVPMFLAMVRDRGIEDIVSFPDGIPYREALAEMCRTDVLLVMQASNCNHLIPAKIYECFRARRPVIALTDPRGDTATKLIEAGIDSHARLDDVGAICDLLTKVARRARRGELPIATEAAIASANRKSRAQELAVMLDECVSAQAQS